ncbi:MAG: ABC transporter substrate-binding protein [Polyangiaceae bacterium]|nr:ABC transporter substrate-binding protein [Polyangiaceae bacterium]
MRQTSAVAPWLLLGAAVATAMLLSFGAAQLVPEARTRATTEGAPRIVSLAPAVTETLFAIGAGDRVVGVSDFCSAPAAVPALPRAGTSITPSFERIAALEPSVVVTVAAPAARLDALRGLTPTRQLPWLTVADVAASTRELGLLSGQTAAANALAGRFEATLTKPSPPNGPRVLLVLGYASRLSEVWFVRANSIHGGVLAAAGARNAVPDPVIGPPVMSLERLLAIDPDVIVVVGGGATGNDATLEAVRRFSTLTAVRTDRLGAIPEEGFLVPGPRTLAMVEALGQLLARLLDPGSAPTRPRVADWGPESEGRDLREASEW